MDSLVAQMVKNLPATWKIWVQSLGQEGPLEKEMAIHSSTLAWKIPWIEEPDRLESMGTRLDDFTQFLSWYLNLKVFNFKFSISFAADSEIVFKNLFHLDLSVYRSMALHSSTLAWKIPWTEEPGELQAMGSLRVGQDWATSLSLSLSCIGEENGNPLQRSCLENPRDGGARWAAIYSVAQSWTWLKRLSSSSRSIIVLTVLIISFIFIITYYTYSHNHTSAHYIYNCIFPFCIFWLFLLLSVLPRSTYYLLYLKIKICLFVLIYIFLLFLISLFYFPFYYLFLPHVYEIILGGCCFSSSVENVFKFLFLCCCLVAKTCLTLCDPLDYSLPGSSVYEISKARILQWAVISFSKEVSWPRDQTHVFCIQSVIADSLWWATREAFFIIINVFKGPNFLLTPVVSIF